ncbi:hypothetical protein [Leifsonia aquatica]|uniref:hypothetical protein n=1 Tax=Leifsonia aquatica TaxID=144185 RepID=UPI0037FA7AD1
MWSTYALYRKDLKAALAAPAGQAARSWRQSGGQGHPESVSVKTLLEFATAASTFADYGTGRNITASNETIAAMIGRSAKTVQRCWAVLERLKLATTVQRGRYLDHNERMAARAAHGRTQLRMASRRDLTPTANRRLHQNTFVRLPPVGNVESTTPRNTRAVNHAGTFAARVSAGFDEKFSEHQRASAQERATASPPPSPDQRGRTYVRKTSRVRRAYKPLPRPVYEFAAGVQAVLPWLRELHPTSIAGVLDRAGIDHERWEPADLLAAINTGILRREIHRVLDAGEQQDPLAYLGWLLAQTIDPADETPTEAWRTKQARRRADQDATRARREQEHADHAARADDFDRHELDSIPQEGSSARLRRRVVDRTPYIPPIHRNPQ